MNQFVLEGEEVVVDLIQSAQNNQEFKIDFISNPKKIIEERLGNKLNLPENVSIVVEDQANPSIIYLNIPAMPDFDSMELTEEDLDQVAGGSTPLCYLGVAALAAGVTYGAAYAIGYYSA